MVPGPEGAGDEDEGGGQQKREGRRDREGERDPSQPRRERGASRPGMADSVGHGARPVD